MILAEKIIKLRKQNGWSQEELAARLNVSRQSVSKWESAASILELTERAAKKIAAGVAVCIISPVLLILLAGLAEFNRIGITENMAGGIGTTILLFIIAASVAVFIMQGMQLEKYEYLEKEVLSFEYGVTGIAEVKKEAFEPVFKKCIVTGVSLCIASVIPIMIAAAFDMSDLIMIYAVALLLVIVVFGVYLFVWSGMIWGSYQKLLEEGDYTREKKYENKKNDNLSKVYWYTMTAIYLGVSFVTRRWDTTWVIWPCAGVLYAAVCGIAAMLRK